MHYRYIASQSEFNQMVKTYQLSSVLVIDTEFVRTSTYYPELGLVQIYDGSNLSLIDVLAVQDPSPLAEILSAPKPLKVMHACSEDIEALARGLNCRLTEVFDTQLCATLLGFRSGMGYANLVNELLDIELDKGESRTDWLARPLSPQQCNYAALDVLHLYDVYQQLEPRLSSSVRTILMAETEALIAKKHRPIRPDLAYLQVSNAWRLRKERLRALRRLAQWRIETAMARNVPLNRVLKEVNMFAIANQLPTSKAGLFSAIQSHPGEVRRHADALLEQLALADSDEMPPAIPALTGIRQYKPAIAALKRITEELAEELQLPVPVLASKRHFHQFLQWCWFEFDETDQMGLLPDVLSGWRRPLFAPKLSGLFSKTGKFDVLRSI